MSERRCVRAVDLKRIEQQSSAVSRFLAVLRRESRDPWATRFAASGGKPILPAPPRARR